MYQVYVNILSSSDSKSISNCQSWLWSKSSAVLLILLASSLLFDRLSHSLYVFPPLHLPNHRQHCFLMFRKETVLDWVICSEFLPLRIKHPSACCQHESILHIYHNTFSSPHRCFSFYRNWMECHLVLVPVLF